MHIFVIISVEGKSLFFDFIYKGWSVPLRKQGAPLLCTTRDLRPGLRLAHSGLESR